MNQPAYRATQCTHGSHHAWKGGDTCVVCGKSRQVVMREKLRIGTLLFAAGLKRDHEKLNGKAVL